jgi:hypothetical protein
MKVLRVAIMGAMLVLLAVSYAGVLSPQKASAASPDVKQAYLLPDYGSSDVSKTTCSGKEADASAKLYVFGLKDNFGFCTAKTVFGNSYEEAKSCAQTYCQMCQLTDLTGRYSFAPGTTGPVGFCPATH